MARLPVPGIIYIQTYMHTHIHTQLRKREVTKLKKDKGGYKGGFGRRKGKGKMMELYYNLPKINDIF